MVLVLFAAVVGKIWATDESRERAGSITAKEIRSLEKDDQSHDEEWMGMEEWDSRVGYAS